LQGFLEDFIADLDTEITSFYKEKSPSLIVLNEKLTKIAALDDKIIWKKRGKWLLSKVAMMAVNVAQRKLVRGQNDYSKSN
jgi:hypothetical protein